MEPKNHLNEVVHVPRNENESLHVSELSDPLLKNPSVEVENTKSSDSEHRSQLEKHASFDSRQKWKTIASFIVEFQTRVFDGQQAQQVLVQHSESDEEQVWSSLNDDTIYPWMLSQVNEALERLPEEDRLKVSSPTIEITQIRCLQPLHAATEIIIDEANSFLKDVLYSNSPIALDITFKLIGLNVDELIHQALPYHIQGKFHNHTTGEDFSLDGSQSAHLDEGLYTYISRFQEVTLSPGSYRLQIVVTLHHASVSPAVFEMPIVQVI